MGILREQILMAGKFVLVCIKSAELDIEHLTVDVKIGTFFDQPSDLFQLASDARIREHRRHLLARLQLCVR